MKIWIWNSADGDYLASSRRNAMDKVEEVFPGGTWTRDGDGDMEYHHSLVDEENCYVVGRELNGWR